VGSSVTYKKRYVNTHNIRNIVTLIGLIGHKVMEVMIIVV